MRVRVNGVQREFGRFAGVATVAELLVELGMPDKGVAVAVDGQVVPRAEHGDTVVADGAALEVLTAVQGG